MSLALPEHFMLRDFLSVSTFEAFAHLLSESKEGHLKISALTF
jgi:hypothetical protein